MAGGLGLGRAPDGRVVLVTGALPGERVAVAVTRERRRMLEADLIEVLDASPQRIQPPCPAVARGCGGCDLQHAGLEAQHRWKAEMVTDALRRTGGLEPPEVEVPELLPEWGHRTSVRAAIDDSGRAGLRRRGSHEPVVVDACLVAHPLAEEILVDGRFPGAHEVEVRVGAATGERLVTVTPTVGDARAPDGVRLVGADELDAGRRAWIHEEIDGVRLRMSARSFFQSRPDGAAALVRAVAALAPEVATAEHLVDAYAGVGLLAACLPAADGRRLTAVEWSASAAADARVNLPGAAVRRVSVDRWRPSRAEVVVADPARSGLGRRAAQRLSATGASVLALVSCDPASLGRDAGLLAGEGWRLERVRQVDLFPQTWHVETVSRFVR